MHLYYPDRAHRIEPLHEQGVVEPRWSTANNAAQRAQFLAAQAAEASIQ